MKQNNSSFIFSKIEDIYCRFCWIDISYLTIFYGQLIFISLLHFSDIASDIYFLTLLKENHISIDFFYISLAILLSSFIATSIPSNNETYLSSFSEFLCGIFQIKFITNIYESFKSNKLSQSLINLRLDEALLESTFQSLLQLYLLINDFFNEKTSYLGFIYVYLSVSLSLVSISYTLISNEIETFNNFYIEREETIQICSYGNKVLSILSPYCIILIFYRLTEIFSRIGLLAYFIKIEMINEYFLKYNLFGYNIIFAMIVDFFMANFFEIINYIIKNYSYFYEEEKNMLKDFLSLVSRIFYKIKYLLVYCEPFTLEYIKKDYGIVDDEIFEKNYFGIPFRYMHFISKFINNSIVIGFLIEELINGENKESKDRIASILYITIFFINYVFLYFIWLWNIDRINHNNKFKSLI